MTKNAKKRRSAAVEPPAIAEIRVAGFKSISDEQRIEIRPLTILAGANSSGKSSILQPILLLKQTLEAPYDAGPILLNGPNVKFTSADQLLSRIGRGQSLGSFQVGMGLNTGEWFLSSFRKEHRMGFEIERMDTSRAGGSLTFSPDMTPGDIVKTGITKGLDFSAMVPNGNRQGRWEIGRDRCFLGPVWAVNSPPGSKVTVGARPGPVWEAIIPQVIHLPGLRGNPERMYPVAANGASYPGTFEKYTASVIFQWTADGDEALDQLNADLRLLGLTGGVRAIRANDVQIELQVGRQPDVPPSRPEDRVNIADVGVGVSQTLPVLVALRAAKPGQLVYVEQPETHLHPRAQFALAQVLASAAKRGVRVVVETHSTQLLLGVQALVAEGGLAPDLVKLHWFERDSAGRTSVRGGELDESGTSGDWPQDFDDVMLDSQKRFLDAASKRMFAQ